jgi:lysophospholipase L1-like esterase
VATDDNDTQFVKRYLTKMKAVVGKLRKAYPDAAIMVMSVTDRDQRASDGIQTMKVIPILISYQQQLAAQTQVAYYSMFEAMGGKNSIRRYVDKKWANKDYTHVNYDGGKQLARQFCKSIEAGMVNYRRKQQAGIIK